MENGILRIVRKGDLYYCQKKQLYGWTYLKHLSYINTYMTYRNNYELADGFRDIEKAREYVITYIAHTV